MKKILLVCCVFLLGCTTEVPHFDEYKVIEISEYGPRINEYKLRGIKESLDTYIVYDSANKFKMGDTIIITLKTTK